MLYTAGLGFNPSEPRADDIFPSSSSSSLNDLVGLIFLRIKSLISSPDNVSYIKSALANLCKSSIFSVRTFLALS